MSAIFIVNGKPFYGRVLGRSNKEDILVQNVICFLFDTYDNKSLYALCDLHGELSDRVLGKLAVALT